MELRTYILIDSMQPQFAALTGILLQGDVPVEGMAEVFMELAPASDVYEVLDTALKTADVRPGLLRVEREYGTLEIHSAFQEAVQVAGQNALARFGLTEGDRIKPEVVSVSAITQFRNEVESGQFPAAQHSYGLDERELDKLLNQLG